MIRRINNLRNGQIIIFVLFFFAVAVIITAVLSAMWHVEIEMRSLEKNSQSAFYLAQAGIEEAKACVKNSVSCSSSVLKSLGAGRYSFTVSGAGTTRNLAATGEVLDSGSNVVASRRIEIRVDGVGTSPYIFTDSWKGF